MVVVHETSFDKPFTKKTKGIVKIKEITKKNKLLESYTSRN